MTEPTTEAGRRLLADAMNMDEPSFPLDFGAAILAIEQEAAEKEYYRYARMVSEMRDELTAAIVAAVEGLRVGPSEHPNIARLARDETVDLVLDAIREASDDRSSRAGGHISRRGGGPSVRGEPVP